MIQPLLHQTVQLSIDSYIKKPSHSLLLVAPDGTGKYFIAQWIANRLNLEMLTISVAEDKKLISIDQIKLLYTQTRTGSPLAMIIRDAHRMSVDAQNAFLKLLEEPPENTYFILTAHSLDQVLQTIRSRCQIISVPSPSTDDIQVYVTNNNLYDVKPDQLKPLLATTRGQFGTIHQLITDNDERTKHLETAGEAKQFYSGSPYERFALLQHHSFDPQWARALLNILAIILETLLHQSAPDTTRVAKLTEQAKLIDTTASSLAVSGNPKIHLSRLAVSL